MPTVKTIDELEVILLPKLTKMTDVLAKRGYETLNYFLYDYYTGWTPKVYQRTTDFLHSAVQIKAKPYKDGVKAVVYIDYKSINNYDGMLYDENGYCCGLFSISGYNHGGNGYTTKTMNTIVPSEEYGHIYVIWMSHT